MCPSHGLSPNVGEGLADKHNSIDKKRREPTQISMRNVKFEMRNGKALAVKIMESFKKVFTIAEHEFHLTASIGISVYPDDSDEIDTLLRYADIAMYHAKEKGRNAFQFYNPAINYRSIERIRLETMLRQTLERGELTVYYQPQINVSSRRMVSAEALVRWKHPERGILEPKQFIQAAEFGIYHND